MPTGLRRYQKSGDLHAINFNCLRKRATLDTPEPRDTFLRIFEETRQKYQFEVVGYVVMPTHVHLLISEPAEKPLFTVMQVLKQRFSRTRIETEVWEPRYYDFNVYSKRKRAEKLGYMHDNPVRAGLVTSPAEWPWSSYSAYAGLDPGPVEITLFSDDRTSGLQASTRP
jgi:putative transposase